MQCTACSLQRSAQPRTWKTSHFKLCSSNGCTHMPPAFSRQRRMVDDVNKSERALCLSTVKNTSIGRNNNSNTIVPPLGCRHMLPSAVPRAAMSLRSDQASSGILPVAGFSPLHRKRYKDTSCIILHGCSGQSAQGLRADDRSQYQQQQRFDSVVLARTHRNSHTDEAKEIHVCRDRIQHSVLLCGGAVDM